MRSMHIQDAVKHLKTGGLLIYPTETFFGLGCVVSQDDAIARIFQVKRRLFAMPLPVVLADKTQLEQVAHVPDDLVSDVEKLIQDFWPGSLSLILPARLHLSPLLTGGTGHIAVRVSSHPAPCELARLLGEPLVASSANISGRPAVTRPDDLDEDLRKVVDAMLEASPLPSGGFPSTLVEPLGGGLLLMHRAGAVTEQTLQNAGFSLKESA